ncbi:MAG: copper resistance CopC family protein, partial [Actinomycetota bacterium]
MSLTSHSRPVRLFGLLSLALVAVAWLALPAAAQEAEEAPEMTGSEPQDGAFLHEPPEDVTITFSEPLDPSSTLAVFDECGRQVDAGDTTVTLNELHVSIALKPSGVYVARYTAVGVGEVTGTTEGQISFEVHFGPDCDGEDDEDKGGGGHHHGDGKGDGKGGGNNHEDHQGGSADAHEQAGHEDAHTTHTSATEDHSTHMEEEHATHAAGTGHQAGQDHRKAGHGKHGKHKGDHDPAARAGGAPQDRTIATEPSGSASADAGAL